MVREKAGCSFGGEILAMEENGEKYYKMADSTYRHTCPECGAVRKPKVRPYRYGGLGEMKEDLMFPYHTPKPPTEEG